jgi:tRNA threonylcarbamoyladenosine biosynthesis protein TsaE
MSIFDDLRAGVTTESAEQTLELARMFGAAMPADTVLALSGDLGTGKTTFVRGLARAWGIEGPITSPSYTLVNIHRGDRTLVHVDAYRLDNPAAADGLMIEDFLHSPYALAIEWPDNLGDWVPDTALRLILDLHPDGRHAFTLTAG